MSKLLRGFRDLLPPATDLFSELEGCARKVFAAYGAVEVRIPTLELKDLFVKSTGDTTDIVQKEMYAFEDGGGREVAMRPEGTPGTVRAYIENRLNEKAPYVKLFYIGNMFRAERPQAGRYREFEQIGVECIGSSAPYADAESILILRDIVTAFGVKNYSVKINSLGCDKCRPAYREQLVKYLQSKKGELCEKCVERMEKNPLRVMDCKLDGAKIKEGAPKMQLCGECETHFSEVKKTLDGRIEYKVDDALVRGLDYYNRTVFEFQAGDAAQNAIAGGGRYDGLVKSMGGPDVPAVGFAMGVDRTVALREAAESKRENKVCVVSLDASCNAKAFEIMQDFRKAGIATDGGLFDKNLKTQMKQADKTGASYAVILGTDEMAAGKATLKNLADAQQTQIPFDDLINEVKKLYEKN